MIDIGVKKNTNASQSSASSAGASLTGSAKRGSLKRINSPSTKGGHSFPNQRALKSSGACWLQKSSTAFGPRCRTRRLWDAWMVISG